jgi:uncharacterized protein
MDVTFVLTHDCNLACGYCYAGRKFRKAMTPEVRDQALALAFEDVMHLPEAERKVDLSYFGGEPLLAWDMLVETARTAVEQAKAKGVKLRQSVTTNGTLLTKERAATLKEIGFYIALSIDGIKEAHNINRPDFSGKGTFDQVEAGLRNLIELRANFETISVMTPKSVPMLAASVDYLYELGVPRVSINPCYEAIWTDADLEVMQAQYVQIAHIVAKWYRSGRIVSFPPFDAKIITRLKGGLETGDTCSLGMTAVSVAPSGNLYPCERLVGEDEDHRSVIGHVASGIDKKKQHGYREHMPDHHAENDECDSCDEKGRCGAYCACANLAETGNASIAGGVQCLYERVTMTVADSLADVLFAEKTKAFMDWYFPHGVIPDALPAVGIAKAVAQKGGASKRHLPVV